MSQQVWSHRLNALENNLNTSRLQAQQPECVQQGSVCKVPVHVHPSRCDASTGLRSVCQTAVWVRWRNTLVDKDGVQREADVWTCWIRLYSGGPRLNLGIR